MKNTLSLLLVSFAITAQAQITSTFSTDADGWTFYHGPTGTFSTVNHNTSGGNPGGFISVTYDSHINTSAVQYWIAPAKYLGTRGLLSIDKILKFDMQQSVAGTNSSTRGDIRIKNGGNSIVYSFPSKPAVGPLWTAYSLLLNETGGWQWGSSGPIATRAQIKSILSNVTAIEINGTYAANASYTSGLDNIILEQQILPIAPSISSFSQTSGEPGTAITITGTNFDPTPANNVVHFKSVGATITAASTTQLSVVVPVGASYGPITIINKTTGLIIQSKEPFNPTFEKGGRIIPASFKPKIDILLDATAGNDLRGLTVADIDGDGWNDVLVSESSINGVSIFRNLGTGGELSTTSFAPKVSIIGAGNANGLRILDLDGDGKQDVATEYSDGFLTSFGTFRNTSTPGNLSFEPVELWAGLVYSGALSAVEDVDGDGRFDLIGQHGNGSTAVDFWIAQNISRPGDIEFGSSVSYFGGSTLDAGAGVSTGDLDNDGIPEIIVKQTFANQFQIIKNNSTPGLISLGTPFPIVQSSYGGIVISDFNLDGKNDLAWKQGFNNDDVHIRLNTNNGAALAATDFDTEIILDSELSYYGAISIGDVNGDGRPDILISDGQHIGAFENNFDGGAFSENSFIRSHIFEASGNSANPTGVISADLNGDQKPDLIVGITNINPLRVLVYENKNVHAPVISVNTVSPLAGPIGSTVTITGNNFSTIPSDNHIYFGAVKASVLTASETEITVSVPAGASYAPVGVRKGELTSRYRLPFRTTFGPGVTFDNTHFAPPINFTLTSANYGLDVGDLNRDGKPDIIAQGNGSYIFRNTHASGIISSSSLLPDDTLATSILNPRLEDFDGDGLPDVAAGQGQVQKNNSTSSEISFLPVTSLGGGGSSLDFGDFNTDGKMDITITVDGNGTSDLKILENRTANLTGNFVIGTYSSFSTNFLFNKPAPFGGVVTEDFDGNGFPDMVTTNPLTDNISIFRNMGILKISSAQFATRIDVAVGDNPGRIYKGDFDADGKVDLMLYHGSGTTTTLLTVLQNTSTVGNVSFSRVDLTNPAATTVAHVADLDGDGRPEIITTSEAGDIFSIFKNIHTNGVLTAASFAAPFNTTVNNPRALATGDLNLDGKPEIIITAAPSSLLVYENLISSGPAITVNPQPTSIAVCDGVTTSFTLTATGANNLTYQWQKFDGTIFNTVTNTGGYSGATTATLSVNTTGNFGAGDYRCLIKGDLAPDKFSNTANLTINAVPAAPTANGNSNCVPAAITLTASGGTNGQYRWYDASGVIIAAQVNSTYVTPVISTTTNYSVAINNGSCESTKTTVTATIQPLTKPTLVSSRSITGGNVNLCEGESFTLTAPAGFTNYNWSNGESTQQITLDEDGTYNVILTDAASCVSPASDPVNVIVNPFPLAEITANGTQLTASSGDSYQWYQNGSEVSGATSQTFDFNVLEYGVYAVDVTDNGCTSTSDEFEYLITGLEQNNDGLKLYPNPVEENLFIEFKPPYTIQVIGVTGIVIQNHHVESATSSLDFSSIAKGIYFLKIRNDNQTRYLRIIKK